MTDVQKMQVAAMAQEGMRIDEIVAATELKEHEVRGFVTERNKQKRKLSNKTKQAIVNWYKKGNSESKTANCFGVSISTVHRTIAVAKSDPKNEVTSDAPESAPKEKPVEAQPKTIEAEEQPTKTNDTTKIVECQALSGIDMIDDLREVANSVRGSEIARFTADDNTAHVEFRYKGISYVLSFNRIS